MNRRNQFLAVNLILGFFLLVSFYEVESAEVSIKEWEIPTINSAPHDVVVDKDGVIWFTEINTDKIGKFDPVLEQFTEYDIPTPSARPHGLVADNQGFVWFTEVGAGKIGKLDAKAGTIEEFSTPTPNSGPHTPIFAPNGILWFTEQAASKIGMLDTKTGQFKEFSTITPSANPYGIITDQVGNAWFAELNGDKIGKVDIISGNITEYSPPTENNGARRIAIDSNGILWFTEYNVGKIASFDPKTEEFKEYETSSASSGPYAIWVDPFDNVWFSMTGIYKIAKFDQATQEITEYDLPSPQTHVKFIHIDNNGNVWYPNYNNNKIGVIYTSQQEKQIKVKEDLDVKNIIDTPHEHSELPPPLQQVRQGTEPTEVMCEEGLELVLRQADGQPACVRTSSVPKLIERGWAIHILPDYEKSENNNSVAFTVGEYETVSETIEYHPKAMGYLSKPSGEEVLPAVIMIHEFWGLNDNIKEMADKLASHGYIVLAVDLYEGKVGKTADEARQIRGSFEQSQWTLNMNSAVSYLDSNYNPTSIGSLGWCFGGGQSLNLALNNDKMDATIIYYGQIVTDAESLSTISWPVLGIFAGEDTGIPIEKVQEFQSTLDELGIENDIVIYPGVNHAFANPSGDRYAPEEAADAWKKTLDFLQMHLT